LSAADVSMPPALLQKTCVTIKKATGRPSGSLFFFKE
jgi:hypothetical protein